MRTRIDANPIFLFRCGQRLTASKILKICRLTPTQKFQDPHISVRNPCIQVATTQFFQMSTNMAASVFTDYVIGDHSNLSHNMPASAPSKPCCDSHLHDHGDVKVPTIFDAVKSGFVVMCCGLYQRQNELLGVIFCAWSASNALSSLTRAACRTATVCSLQTQAGAAAGQATPVSCTKVPTFRNPCK